MNTKAVNIQNSPQVYQANQSKQAKSLMVSADRLSFSSKINGEKKDNTSAWVLGGLVAIVAGVAGFFIGKGKGGDEAAKPIADTAKDFTKKAKEAGKGIYAQAKAFIQDIKQIGVVAKFKEVKEQLVKKFDQIVKGKKVEQAIEEAAKATE